jgi:deoxycytidylate deaminase
MTSPIGEIIDNLFVAARDHDSHGKAKLAAAIYNRRKLISYGFNDYTRSHPLQKQYGVNDEACFVHAEMAAIISAKREDLSGKTIYVARARKIAGRWESGLALPCPGCRKAIEDFGFRRIVFSLNAEGFGTIEI